MQAVCKMTLNESATSDQLKELAESLERHCDSVEEFHGCYASVAVQHLANLRAGELPAPFVVDLMNTFDLTNKVREILKQDALTIDASQRRLIQDELGERAFDRGLVIHITYTEDCPYDEVIQELRSMFDHSLVTNIDVSEVPADEELDDDLVD
jgi:hypothetical protein